MIGAPDKNWKYSLIVARTPTEWIYCFYIFSDNLGEWEKKLHFNHRIEHCRDRRKAMHNKELLSNSDALYLEYTIKRTLWQNNIGCFYFLRMRLFCDHCYRFTPDCSLIGCAFCYSFAFNFHLFFIQNPNILFVFCSSEIKIKFQRNMTIKNIYVRKVFKPVNTGYS